MTTTYHDPIASLAMADAATFNAPLGQLDAMLNTLATSTDALDTRMELLVLAGSNVSTLTNGAANAGQKVVTVDSTTGFLGGAPVAYTLVGGVIETNTVGTVDSPTQLTLTVNIGTGGIANDTFLSVVPLGSLLATGAVDGATGSAQTFVEGVTLGDLTASTDDSAMIIARAVGGTINSHGVRDESVLTAGSAAVGYAAFDSQYTAGGTATYDHIAGTQSRMIYTGAGVLSEWRGHYSLPYIQGPTTTVKHLDIRNAIASDGGTLTNQYGLFIEALDEASTENYAIYTVPSTPSLFGGKVNVQANLAENGTGAFDGHIRLAALATSDHLALGWNNTGGYGWMQALKASASVYAPIILNANGGNVGIGTAAPASRLDIDAGAMTMKEMSAPSAPAANSVVIYAVDNGAGKTQLMARFASGAAQQIAIEP